MPKDKIGFGHSWSKSFSLKEEWLNFSDAMHFPRITLPEILSFMMLE